MPERALLRLRRAKIDLYSVKKVEKNQILFSVSKKDSEKVFAIYPNVCYNSNGYTPYTARKAGAEGLLRILDKVKSRIGLLLGGLLFLAGVCFADRLVFDVAFTGTQVYAREVRQVLERNGIKPFAAYPKGKEDLVCAELLRLHGVEFCSVQKKGGYVAVEMRLSPFVSLAPKRGDMQAKHSGTVLSITVLKGMPLKKAGDTVTAGDTLVGGWYEDKDGGQVRVEPIARAYIACVYENVFSTADESEAFANAYLDLALGAKDFITEKQIAQTQDGFKVTICYTVIETVNL